MDTGERRRLTGFRIYISADIEGVPGIVSKEHTRPGGCEYESARDWMTAFSVAACGAARAEGASEVVISDSHGNGLNLRPDAFPGFVRLVRGWPRPLGMMEGIDLGSYAGALLLGYHSSSDDPAGTLSHTLSSDLYQSVRLDGAAVSEAEISRLIAAHYGVPVIFIAGDDAFLAEAGSRGFDCPAFETKLALSTTSAVGTSPASNLPEFRSAVASAVRESRAIGPPVRPKGPFTLDLTLRTRAVAEWLTYIPVVERTGAFGVRYLAPDVLSLSKFLMFAPMARSALAV